MRLALAIALFFLPLCDAAETAQQPTVQITPEKAAQQKTDDEAADPRDNRVTPLTPEEEMQRQIRLFDPLDRSGQDQTPNRTPGARDARSPTSRPAASGDTGDGNSPTATPAVDADDRPLPGSVAASLEQSTNSAAGPRVSEDGAQTGEYTGPAVLSRSYTINSLAIPTDAKWTESLAFMELYDTGTGKPLPDAAGVLHGTGSAGTSVSWTFGGHRAMKHDEIGFSYSGSMSRYVSNGSYSGSNNTLSISWTHLISRHLTLSGAATGSSLSSNATLQNQSLAPGATVADVNLGLSPNVQPTDMGTKQVSTQLNLAWQQSARLSFNFSTGYFGMIRNAPGLVGATGNQAQGSANYRYSRRTTVGLFYSYGHNQYPHGFGASDSNSAGVTYSIALGRSLQIKLRGGLSKTESIAESEVPLPPLLAALLGRPSGVIDAYRGTSSGDYSAQIVKDFGRRRTAFFAFTRGVSPGNGVLLTSMQESLSFGLNAKLFRRYSFSATGSSDSLTSISQTYTSQFQSKSVLISLNRSYKGGFSINSAISYRYFGTTNPMLEPNQLHFSSGISWSPAGAKLWPF